MVIILWFQTFLWWVITICGFMTQLVGELHQHCEVTSSNPCWNPKFFRLLYLIANIGFKIARNHSFTWFRIPRYMINIMNITSFTLILVIVIVTHKRNVSVLFICLLVTDVDVMNLCSWRHLVWCVEKDSNDKNNFQHQLGSRNGIVLIALTSHLRGPGLGQQEG